MEFLTRTWSSCRAQNQVDECNRLCLLKNSVREGLMSSEYFLRALLLFRLGDGRQNRRYRLAEEAHQSLDVLCSGCEEELLPHELHAS
jgi:hypothetical protein